MRALQGKRRPMAWKGDLLLETMSANCIRDKEWEWSSWRWGTSRGPSPSGIFQVGSGNFLQGVLPTRGGWKTNLVENQPCSESKTWPRVRAGRSSKSKHTAELLHKTRTTIIIIFKFRIFDSDLTVLKLPWQVYHGPTNDNFLCYSANVVVVLHSM